MGALRREVLQRRRRSYVAFGLIGTVGLHIIAAIAIWSSLHEPPPDPLPLPPPPAPPTAPVAVAEPMQAPDVAPPPVAPPPVVVPRIKRTACPRPRADAPTVTLPDFDDSFVDHVVAAPTNAGWVAVWSASNVYVSYDAGASYTHALGPVHETIASVAFDCHGNLAIAADAGLAVFDGVRLHWLPTLPVTADAELTLIGGGPDLVVVQHETTASVAISHDLGATWTWHEVGAPLDGGRSYEAQGEQAPDGTVRATLSAQRQNANGYIDEWDVIDVRLRGQRLELGAAQTALGQVHRYGGVELAATNAGVFTRTDAGPWQLVQGIAEPDAWDTAFVGGARPSVIVGGVLYTIQRGRARKRLAWPEAQGRTSWEPAVIDRAGRVWGIEGRDGGSCDGTSTPVLVGRIPR